MAKKNSKKAPRKALPRKLWWGIGSVVTLVYIAIFYYFFVGPTGFRWRALYGDAQYPEGYEQVKAPSVGEIMAKKIENYKARIEQEGKEYADKEMKEMLKWATRLKTLPDHEEEILEKELKIAPHTLGENLEQFANNEYKGSMVQLFDAYSKVKGLLKGTAWDVK